MLKSQSGKQAKEPEITRGKKRFPGKEKRKKCENVLYPQV